MNQDKEHLRLLAIFHYIVAGLGAFFSLFPLFYSVMGGFLLYAAHHPAPHDQEPAPALVGWIFIVVGALLCFTGLAMAICILIAGRALGRQRYYWFAFVMACIQCLFMPFGTILGVFTIVVLSRESVKALFSTAPAPG